MSRPIHEKSAPRSGSLSGKHVILGVGGGIAAYKSCDLASQLVKAGAVVTAVLTKGAQKLVTPYTFEALTGQPCLTRMFHRIGPRVSPYPHLKPAEDAALAIVAPATANLMARLAHGLASDLLSTLLLSARCPVLVCPAMNTKMWEHPATQANATILQSYGYKLLGPASGRLACGTEGAGRMVEPAEIVAAARAALGS
jgi:phosphopantothenoylcysteine decarboxylase/phosphopantothenate--cysteine ligase